MYAWQTLAMARTEWKIRKLPAGVREIKGATRDLLYRIGQPHFPDPYVESLPEGLELRWDIDGRALIFAINPEGEIEYHKYYPGQDSGKCGEIVAGACQPVWDLVEWILFGTSVPT